MLASRATTGKRKRDSKTMSTRVEKAKNAAVKETPSSLLPITVLAGFLGAGKTTLLKYILETKHENDDFKCAVIVNDMAELNIDKALVDTSAIAQADTVIAMQNGCVCCSLAADLSAQIIDLASKGTFNYMILEASGVSEPAAIAQIFATCEEDHAHDSEDHDEDAHIGDVARLDTCVTVVAADQFLGSLLNVNKGPENESWPRLMMEQIEHANVIVLNKTDLVSKSQLSNISSQVSLLNPTATIIEASNSIIDVAKVVGTNMYDESLFQMSAAVRIEPEETPQCCKTSVARGESACCKRARTIRSAVSEVLLSPKISGNTRHASRFGITSFLYKARRPFHPKRFLEEFLNKYFLLDEDDEEDEEDEEDEDDKEDEDDENKKKDAENDENDVTGNNVGKQEEVDGGQTTDDEDIEKRQQDALSRQEERIARLGNLMRTKGFVWMPQGHDLMGVVSQAGNIIQMSFDKAWSVLDGRAYRNTTDKALKVELRKDWQAPWGDRRQELVFIGQNLNHKEIQSVLDACLMNDNEFAMGPDGWKATLGDLLLGGLLEHVDNDYDEETLE